MCVLSEFFPFWIEAVVSAYDNGCLEKKIYEVSNWMDASNHVVIKNFVSLENCWKCFFSIELIVAIYFVQQRRFIGPSQIRLLEILLHQRQANGWMLGNDWSVHLTLFLI